MKMDEQLIKSKKRFSSIWRRILHNRVLNNGRAAAKTDQEVFVGDDPKYSDDSECDKENSSLGKASEEDLTKTYSCVMPSPQCLPTILKKSQTDPTYHHTSERHATFKEVVKVHEYVVQDSIEYEEHYTSETSLTDDDDEHVPNRKGFYVDNYPDQDATMKLCRKRHPGTLTQRNSFLMQNVQISSESWMVRTMSRKTLTKPRPSLCPRNRKTKNHQKASLKRRKWFSRKSFRT